MSGIQLVNSPLVPNTKEVIMANSASFDRGDPVKIDSNGFLAPVAAGDKVEGFFAQADTDATSDNQTVAQAKGKYDPVTAEHIFDITADQACTQTDLGAYADFAVAAGVFQLNLAAGSSGQCYVMDFDPDRDGTTTKVRCKIAEPEYLAFAQV